MPHARPDIVLGYALAILVSFAKQELGKGMPLFSDLVMPLRGRGQILRHARRYPPAYSAHQHFLARYFCRSILKPWRHLLHAKTLAIEGAAGGLGLGVAPIRQWPQQLQDRGIISAIIGVLCILQRPRQARPTLKLKPLPKCSTDSRVVRDTFITCDYNLNY